MKSLSPSELLETLDSCKEEHITDRAHNKVIPGAYDN